MSDDDVVEINDEPEFYYGDKVQSKKHIKNDGTFPMRDIGEVIVKKGDVGYVSSIGTFLQRYYIYGVDFYERGVLVGMRGKELDMIEMAEED